MAQAQRRYSKDEFAQRGDAIYASNVSPQLNAEDEGKFVAIDIETGEYEIGNDELKTGRELRTRLPAAQIWMVRVGRRYVHRFGGGTRRQIP